MDKEYNRIVFATRMQINDHPGITDEQLLGYVQYLGVFVEDVRKRIVADAKKRKLNCGRCGAPAEKLIEDYCKECNDKKIWN